MNVRGRRLGRALACAAAMAVLVPAGALAHGGSSEAYEAEIFGVKPTGLPIDVRVQNGDQLRIENVGDGDLLLCGYGAEGDGGCEEYVQIEPDGVYVNHNSRSYYANLDTEQYGDVPDDVGTGGPDWQRLRREPAFFAYHDHRIHWMGGTKSLPPGVDENEPGRQTVNDFTVDLRYDGTPAKIEGRLYYVGGQNWLQRYGEYALTVGAILAMLVVFFVDARRRRRRRAAAVALADGGDDGSPSAATTADAAEPTRPTTTVLLPEGASSSEEER